MTTSGRKTTTLRAIAAKGAGVSAAGVTLASLAAARRRPGWAAALAGAAALSAALTTAECALTMHLARQRTAEATAQQEQRRWLTYPCPVDGEIQRIPASAARLVLFPTSEHDEPHPHLILLCPCGRPHTLPVDDETVGNAIDAGVPADVAVPDTPAALSPAC